VSHAKTKTRTDSGKHHLIKAGSTKKQKRHDNIKEKEEKIMLYFNSN
jgi:hypothetical protein